jgi:phenylacetate-CoA ligase
MTHYSVPVTPLDTWIKEKIDLTDVSLTRQSITKYQLKKLQETIDLAYRNSPFYHDLLQGIAEQKLTCLEDLTRLPFTSEEDIKSNALQMLCVSQSEINRVVTLDTSGTTGKPKRLYFTKEDQELTIDFFKAGMSTFTSPGDRVLILLPCERPGSVGDLLAIALERLGAIPFKYGIIRNIAETIKRLADTKANVAVGIPVQILALARFYETNVFNMPIFLRRILLSTDYLSQAINGEIQRILKCEVFDHYGMTEMGLGGGVECCAHSGYHLREADLYFEIIDPLTGEPLPAGIEGEVVFTTLTRQGMPSIRYRTGDMARFIPGECQCGTVLHRLDYIKARKTGRILIDDDYHLTIGDLDEKLLKLKGVVDYNASVFHQTSSIILKIQIKALGRTVTEPEIHYVLDQIPGIQLAKSRKKIEVLIESLICNNDFVPGVGKRKIKFN